MEYDRNTEEVNEEVTLSLLANTQCIIPQVSSFCCFLSVLFFKQNLMTDLLNILFSMSIIKQTNIVILFNVLGQLSIWLVNISNSEHEQAVQRNWS